MLAGIITTQKMFHVAVSVPKQWVFQHKIIFQQKNILAGISQHQNFPKHTLNPCVSRVGP